MFEVWATSECYIEVGESGGCRMQVEVCKLASCLKGPLRGIRAKGTQGWARAKQWNQRNTILT